MRASRGPGRLRVAVGAIAAAGLVMGIVATVTGAETASADQVSLTLNYTCQFPAIPPQPLTVEITTDLPSQVAPGEEIPPAEVSTVSTVSEGVQPGLRAIGARTLEGTAEASVQVTAPNLDTTVPVEQDIASTPIPTEPGDFPITTNGTTPPMQFTEDNIGTGTVSVGTLVLTMTPRDANGNATGMGTFESECTVDPGQDTVLHTFEIGIGGGPLGYDLTGESSIEAAQGTVPLSGTVAAQIDTAAGTYTADLSLDPTRGDFRILGVLPASADIEFDPAGQTTGSLEGTSLTSRSEMFVELPRINLLGVPIGGGPDCRTSEPAVIELRTPEGESFDPATGGNLQGSYSLPPFEGCGALTPFVNAVVAGPNNTVDVTLAPSADGSAPAEASTAAADSASTQASTQASDEEFYTPPDPLPEGQPGDIIRARPASAGPPAARELADAWQVMYLSTDGTGERNAVTGTILVPQGVDPAAAPIVGFGPGTHGPAFQCAPSRMINRGAFYEQSAINDMLQRGYAVAVTDYEGYHPQPDSTYMVGRSMGPALIDAVRAAQRLPEAGLSAETPVVFRGYSQGGGAAMWAGQLHPEYAPEVNLVGVAGGGVPANLVLVGAPLIGSDGFGVLLYALLGQDNAFPDVSMDPHLNEAGRAEIARMPQEVCVLDLLVDYAGKDFDDYFTSNPLTPERIARINESTLGAQPIQVPVFQYHETGDQLVAFPQAETLRNDYCAQDVDLTWQTYETGGETGVINHINLVFHGNEAVNQFIEERLAGTPPSSNC